MPSFGMIRFRAGSSNLRGRGGYGGVILVVSFSLRTKGYLACDAGCMQGGVACKSEVKNLSVQQRVSSEDERGEEMRC